MSYTPQMVQAAPLTVGSRAFVDPLLAKASLDASTILLAMARRPPADRLEALREGLERLGVNASQVIAELRRGFGRPVSPPLSPDQFTFDVLRLALANSRMDSSVDNWRHLIGSQVGWDSALGSLSPNDRATGCMISGGAQTVGGIAQIIPIYGTIIGGIASIGGAIAGGQLDCAREAREAAAQAAAAQVQLAAAQQAATAAQQASSTASRRQRLKTIGVGGAALVAILGATWWILD